MKTIEIYCENNNTTKAYPLGTSLEEIKDDMQIKLQNPVCGALVNHKVKELSFSVVKSKRIQFIDYSHPDGRRLYTRSLLFCSMWGLRKPFRR
jgi:uridine kinase